MEIKSRPGGEKTLGQILVEKGIIRQEQLDQALRIKAEQPGKYLGEILFEIGVPTGKNQPRPLLFQQAQDDR